MGKSLWWVGWLTQLQWPITVWFHLHSVNKRSGLGWQKLWCWVPEQIKNPTSCLSAGPNLDPYPSKLRLCQVLLELSIPISGSMFLVFLFLVASRYPNGFRKILMLVCHCPFRVKRLPLKLTTKETRYLPHPEKDSQCRVNDFCYCTMRTLGGDWMQPIIDEVLAIFQPKTESDMIATPFWKLASTKCPWQLVL